MALVKASENIPLNLPQKISEMIGGVLLGILGGMSVLTENATGIKGFINFVKNSKKLFAAIDILKAASVALSMFASALGAFARLDSMRPIIGTDSKGEPIFGEAVNITQVSTNIATSISGFINALIRSTDTLMEEKADGLERMGEILTGKDGILAAVNQFAQVLQTFAQFGQNNEIGFSYIDEKGEQKYDKVSATVVAGHIISAFMTFVTELTTKGENFRLDKQEGKKMKRLASILMGDPEESDEPGLLSPIFKFAELLKMFTGADETKISFLDEKGEVQSVDPVQAAKLLLGGITAFITAIGSQEFDESAVQKFGALMDKISGIDKTIPRLTKVSTTLVTLSESIDKLTKSMKLFVKESGVNQYIKDIENINKLELQGIQQRAQLEREEKEKDYELQKKHLEGLSELNSEDIKKLAEANKAIQISQQSLVDLADTIVNTMAKGDYTFKFESITPGSGNIVFKQL
jgi:hypothetical protein